MEVYPSAVQQPPDPFAQLLVGLEGAEIDKFIRLIRTKADE
jgi:hypothetical protein